MSEKQTEAPDNLQLERFHPNSAANAIALLNVGESYSRAVRIPLASASKEEIDETMLKLRSLVGKTAQRAGGRSGNTYVVETGSFMTRSCDIIVSAVVTRTD